MIRIVLPYSLQGLARVRGEVELPLPDPRTREALVAALEERYPALRGTIRDPATGARRPFLRFFACGRDLSHEPSDAPLPDAVVRGEEPFLIVGAVAGG